MPVPANRILEAKLRNAVEEIYANEQLRDGLTVRLIRDKVEEELDLGAGFFSTPEWKDKSKGIIKDWAVSGAGDQSLRAMAHYSFHRPN